MRDYKLMCEVCNKEYFRSTDRFCSDCGSELKKINSDDTATKVEVVKHCFECGTNYTNDRNTFCNQCGHKLVDLPQETGTLSTDEIKDIALKGLKVFNHVEIDVNSGSVDENQPTDITQVREHVLHCFDDNIDYNDKDFVFCLECSNELAKFSNSESGDLLTSLRNWEIVICDKGLDEQMECTLGVFTGTFTELVSKFSGCRFNLKLIPTTKKAYFDSSRLVYKRVNKNTATSIKSVNIEVVLEEKK